MRAEYGPPMYRCRLERCIIYNHERPSESDLSLHARVAYTREYAAGLDLDRRVAAPVQDPIAFTKV